MNLPTSYRSTGSFDVASLRRTAYSTVLPIDCRRTDLEQYQGQTIRLDGRPFRVSGVESRCTVMQHAGWPISFVGEFLD